MVLKIKLLFPHCKKNRANVDQCKKPNWAPAGIGAPAKHAQASRTQEVENGYGKVKLVLHPFSMLMIFYDR